MPKATLSSDEFATTEIIRDEWTQLAEEVGAELAAIFASGTHPESLTIEFAGMTMAEWEALPEEMRRDLQEYGAD